MLISGNAIFPQKWQCLTCLSFTLPFRLPCYNAFLSRHARRCGNSLKNSTLPIAAYSLGTSFVIVLYSSFERFLAKIYSKSCSKHRSFLVRPSTHSLIESLLLYKPSVLSYGKRKWYRDSARNTIKQQVACYPC